ncbi:flagellar filament capping protein FliD (plasmid) [Pontibacillus sp. ALD_SL1]|uniref:flagellar filament capping protein FliD n=1 Tax=Pontibacillus sp. ALD_SL1 TaxID=2777185 RepID=UPI001A977D8F|nr:flagellar filament capping protein FliD [Pontibacillus sp. ALD_SL1]QST03026.1 flagellar filament capping protein FliD [Pontibacillus sp. ALD_SL1]
MSELFGNTQMSYFGDRLQLWGMGSSGGVDTKSLLEAELQMLQMKDVPYNNQKSIYEQEKKVWGEVKKGLTSLTESLENLKSLSSIDRKAVSSDEEVLAVSATSESIEGRYEIQVHQLAQRHKISSDSLGDSSIPMGVAGVFQINGNDVVVDDTMSLNDLASLINDNSFGAKAVVIGGTMVFTSEASGEEGAVVLNDPEGILTDLGFLDSTGAVKNEIRKAQNASLTIDGISIDSSNNTVSNPMTGVTITLKEITETPVYLTIERNNETIQEKVSAFVEAYNKAIMQLNTYTGEGAVLQGESLLNTLQMELSSRLMRPTDSSYYLFQGGVQTNGNVNDGTLVLDEAILQEKLSENPDELLKLFGGENGIGQILYSKMNEVTKAGGLIDGKIDGIGKSIEDINDTLFRNAEQFELRKEKLIEKYAKFEMMMTSLQSQMDYMEAALGGMEGDQ